MTGSGRTVSVGSVLDRAGVQGGLSTLEDHQAVWDWHQARKAKLEDERLRRPTVRLWDGDYTLRGEVAGERGLDFEFIENETGTASIQLSLDHYLAKWIMDHTGRNKRNVHVTFDKQGARWSGRMDRYTVTRDKYGDAYLDVWFKHDYEELKHVLCWANPALRPELQFPKLFVLFGPSRWSLSVTLFLNLLRLESSLWSIPDDPLDPTEWMGPSFWPGFWRNQVKPFPIIADNSPLTIVFSRFKTFHDVAKQVLADAQLTMVCRRYLDGDPHPYSELQGELGIESIEKLFEYFPVRHGCLIWSIEDNSEWGTETAFGGSWLTGLVRAVVNIADDGTTEGVSVFTGDATYPGEYYSPWYLGTSPKAPWVVFEEGVYTGITQSEFSYFEATDTSFVTGGQSMPGVNEAISAAINMTGDLIAAEISFMIGYSLPPIGGMMDAIARPLYENVFLAFMQVPSLRASGETLPIAGLEDLISSLGDFHYYEGWADNADRAFTLSALLAIRAKMWATRARTTHTVKISDAAPYYFGEKGYGHFFVGSRVATSVLGYPTPHTLFVERVKKARYSSDKDGPSGWEISIGYEEGQDPVVRAFEMIQNINSNLSQLGIF
jgi:hypothetical protein